MQIEKWGYGLAVRLLQTLVEDMGLREADIVDFVVSGERKWTITRRDAAAEAFLENARAFQFALPERITWRR